MRARDSAMDTRGSVTRAQSGAAIVAEVRQRGAERRKRAKQSCLQRLCAARANEFADDTIAMPSWNSDEDRDENEPLCVDDDKGASCAAHARRACRIVFSVRALLFMQLVALVLISYAALSMHDKMLRMLNPDESGPVLMQTLSNVHQLSANPMEFILREQYADAVGTADRFFEIVRMASASLEGANVTARVPEILGAVAEEIGYLRAWMRGLNAAMRA